MFAWEERRQMNISSSLRAHTHTAHSLTQLHHTPQTPPLSSPCSSCLAARLGSWPPAGWLPCFFPLHKGAPTTWTLASEYYIRPRIIHKIQFLHDWSHPRGLCPRVITYGSRSWPCNSALRTMLNNSVTCVSDELRHHIAPPLMTPRHPPRAPLRRHQNIYSVVCSEWFIL